MEDKHRTTFAAVRKRKIPRLEECVGARTPTTLGNTKRIKSDDISTALGDTLNIVEVSVAASVRDCVAIGGTRDTTTGHKMIGIAVLYDMIQSLGAICSFAATLLEKRSA
jgi:hypothetical protein